MISYIHLSKENRMQSLQYLIENAYEDAKNITPENASSELKQAITAILSGLNQGTYRIAEKVEGKWITHQWLKKAVLLSFRTQANQPMLSPPSQFYDKISLKYANYTSEQFKQEMIRLVPGTIVRNGCYIGKNVVLMPSFVNIGAHIGEGSLIDTWATVGSCAQIGAHVHLSGGVGIGGVLEPLQANPTIIEDHCFIGARSEIVEGVIVEEGSVLSMGVYISQSTRIYDRTTGETFYGRVPAYSVVVPGTLPAADGSHSLYAAIIVKRVDAKTREKVSINELLRETE